MATVFYYGVPPLIRWWRRLTQIPFIRQGGGWIFDGTTLRFIHEIATAAPSALPRPV